MTEELEYYAEPGLMTALGECPRSAVEDLPDDPVAVCRLARGLIVHEAWAPLYGVQASSARATEPHLRSSAAMIRRILELEPSALTVARPATARVFGNCRHFSTLTCALLRHRGIPSRARCGFAAYFQPGKHVDHWVTEYWDPDEGRWVRFDSQVDDVQAAIVRPSFDTEDLPAGAYLAGGEAWRRCRAGEADAATFGIFDFWGPAEVRGNAVRDLAALNKMELLPWDTWGLIAEPDGPESDVATDAVADALVDGRFSELRNLYEYDDRLRVPDMIFDMRAQELVTLSGSE